LNFNLQSGLHHNPFTGSVSMLQSIVLPNNTAWTFQYDPNNGMLIEVTLPTGGTVSYGGRINVVCLHGSYPINYNPDYGSRSVNANDGTGAHTWTYNSGPAACPTSTTVTDPLGNQTVHTFTGLNSSTSLYETQAQYYSGSSSLLKTVTTNYTWNANVSTLDGYPSVINVVPTQVTTTWPVTGGTTVSKVEKDYDAGFSFIDPLGNSYTGIHYGDIVTRRDYDYGSGAPGPLLRRTVTSYQAFSSAPYLTYNLLDAISSVAIYDSTANTCLGIANPCAYTSYGYDATALAGSTITIQRNLSPVNGSTRGNQTSVSPWLNASTTSTTNCSAVTTYLTTNRVFYDTGMVSTSTDPCGYVTTHLYSSTYAGAYTTTLTNPLGQNTTFSYDVNTGLLASTFDANLQPTSNTYDNMGRLAQVSYPDGGQANYCYTDAGGTGCTLSGPPYAVVTTQKITASLKRISTSVFDGLARPIQKQLISDPDGVTYVDITYDADGRAATHSNPHRTGSSTTDGTTTTLYDALNRVCLVAPADAASPPTSCPSSSSLGTAFTSYSGNCTTVTDETGKSRTSCVDGLGRMTDVREDPSGFNYDTAYQYDTLGNMKSVTQKGGAASGSWRTRSFIYNLLSQVTSSNNPESGIIGYTYDADGNAITKTAPMHNQPSSGVTVTSTYSYDKLNRLIKESYSDGTATAQFGYDGVAIPAL
jgi:YD repeat-containing protein